MSTQSVRRHIIIPVVILVLTGVVMFLMHLSSPPAKKKPKDTVIQDVEVLVVKPESYVVPVASQGEVSARTQVRLLPEVSGKIIAVSPKWVNGGYFKKGEMLLRIEDHAYKNQVARTQANVAQAESNYVQEQGLAYVAKKEWDKRPASSREKNPAAKALALREPQLRSSKAQLAAAKAELNAAQLNLQKTTVVAPFDGILLKKSADIGQTISNGQPLGEFYAVDRAEVRAPLTEAQQALIDLPRLDEHVEIPVTLRFEADNQIQERNAVLVNTEGVLDELTKVLYGRVVVNDPYALEDRTLPALRIGGFVEVVIQGKTLQKVFIVPGRLLKRGDKLWLVDENNQLKLQPIEYLKLRNEDLVIVDGLREGDKLAVGSLIKPTEGKQVNPVEVTGE